MLPVEEEDHCKATTLEIAIVAYHESILFEFVYVVKSNKLMRYTVKQFYEDVLKNTPFSPPDTDILS